MTANPVRIIGTVRDSGGRDVPIGVDHDHVTIGDRAFGPEVIDNLMRLAFAADEEAKAWARLNAEDEDDDPFSPDAYKTHKPGCACPDCAAEREERAAFTAEAAELDTDLTEG